MAHLPQKSLDQGGFSGIYNLVFTHFPITLKITEKDLAYQTWKFRYGRSSYLLIQSVSWMVDALLTISEFCIVRIRACPAYAFQLIYHCHVLLGYLKIKKLQILLNPHRGNGFGQRKMSFLQAPPQTDLGCGPAVFLSKLLQLWIFQKLSGTKGTPRLHQDVMLFAEGRRFRLHPAGMELNLVYHRNDLCCFQQRLHMHREKIAYTDGPYIPFFQQIFKGLPGLPVYLLVGIPESQGTGPMDQVQVDVVEPQIG